MTAVFMRVSAEGSWYSNGTQEDGPFTTQQEKEPGFIDKVATDLSTTAEAIQQARQAAILRPMSLDDVAEILDTTIRRDYATKLILFLAGLLTFTNEDQINVLMAGEASGGKSYLAIEITSYFPSGVPMVIGTASPAAFIHDLGEYDKETRTVRIDLRGRIIVLLDQPHYMLLQRLRALLSHDVKELQFKITDRTKSGAHRTKNVIIIGYPTFMFCSAKMFLEEQELTRCFILSPETTHEKLDESLRLLAAKVGDREAYRAWVENHPLRKLLKDRISALKSQMIHEVRVEDQEGVCRRFLEKHPRLAPRHQRDFPRILALIKGHALLNFAHRAKSEGSDRTIVATKEDEEAAFKLYGMIAESNELGLAPEVYEVYTKVLRPLLRERQLVTRQQFLNRYYKFYGRLLSERRLSREVLPSLEAKGLVTQEPDPSDRRKMLLSLSGVEDICATSVYMVDRAKTERNTTLPYTDPAHISLPQTRPISPQPKEDQKST